MSSGELTWVKSSYSSSGSGDCVEVATRPRTIHVRDSKTPQAPHLTLSLSAWQPFIAFAGSGTSVTVSPH
ncbi:uncharacterized protein DUF397 [Streptomyces sp. TLI_55]|uniref:DUF397 domain-containing protein n=1 Tax=Streptomyces sp. TLI_55 TaxID=1938861 RepID=UPI000BCDCF4F|nr:DUF397 domain-containing protein [Streptomyces sp. TLI_55]SNX58208.1 uncharacterized protein DUF397 [Streptomyces sp. TLI_55]